MIKVVATTIATAEIITTTVEKIITTTMMNRVILKKNLRDVGLSIGAGLRAADYTFTGNAIIDDGALFPPGGSGELWID